MYQVELDKSELIKFFSHRTKKRRRENQRGTEIYGNISGAFITLVRAVLFLYVHTFIDGVQS